MRSADQAAGGAAWALGACALGLATLCALLSFWLEPTNALVDVGAFLALMLGAFALSALAVRPARRLADRAPRATVAIILGAAALFRLLLVPAGLAPGKTVLDDLTDPPAYEPFLLYDNDVWRYLWDGHVTAHGLDPFAATPERLGDEGFDEQPHAAPLFDDDAWWDVWDRISFRNYTTVYPPASQALFRLSHALAPTSVAVWKLLLVVCDLGTCWLLVGILRRLGRPPADSILYAWNPLVVKELVGSAHVDALLVLALTGTVWALLHRRCVLAQALFALAVLAKLTPVLAAVPVLRQVEPRRRWILPVLLVAGFAPMGVGLVTWLRGVAAFGREWVFNPGPWLAFETVAGWLGGPGVDNPAAWAHGLSALVILGTTAAVSLTAWRGPGDDPERALLRPVVVILAVLVVMSPAVMPWYLTWILPLAVALGDRSWWLFGALSLVSYLVYAHVALPAWWLPVGLWLEYGLFAVVVAIGSLGAWRKRTDVSVLEETTHTKKGDLAC